MTGVQTCALPILAAIVRIGVVALALNQDAEFRALLMHAPAVLWAAAALLLGVLLHARHGAARTAG